MMFTATSHVDDLRIQHLDQLAEFNNDVAEACGCLYSYKGDMVVFVSHALDRRFHVAENAIGQSYQYGFAKEFKAHVIREIRKMDLSD